MLTTRRARRSGRGSCSRTPAPTPSSRGRASSRRRPRSPLRRTISARASVAPRRIAAGEDDVAPLGREADARSRARCLRSRPSRARPSSRERRLAAHATRSSRPHRPPGLPHLPRHHDLRPAVRRSRVAARSSTRAAEEGITFLDTADAYPLGGDLTTVGPHRGDRRPVAEGQARPVRRRHEVLRADGPEPVGHGQQPRHIMDAIDASLRRLQTDFIDLYQLHFDDPGVPLDEIARRARRPRARRARSRYVGCSNFLAYRLARAIGQQRGARTSRASTRCSRATTCCSASSSASCSRCASKRASA